MYEIERVKYLSKLSGSSLREIYWPPLKENRAKIDQFTQFFESITTFQLPSGIKKNNNTQNCLRVI